MRIGIVALLAGALLAAAVSAQAGERRSAVVLAVERVAPATVNITTTQQVYRSANPFFRGDPLFEEFFGRFADPRPRTVRSLGTGVIIDEQGHVLTNEHVLAGATEIRVALSDGREFEGELIGADPETDLAVVRIMADEELPRAPLGHSNDLMIGETVIAIGNPFGLGHSVTTGVLSAINRSIMTDENEYHGFVQTDASINPGNSGGPLLNIEGDVIGINTAIFREAEGIGFAIPVDRARAIAAELIQHGEVTPVWLGVRVQQLTAGLRTALDVEQSEGALVAHVFEDSPAARQGINRGDLILKLNDMLVRSPRGFFEILRGIPAGSDTRVELERGRQKMVRKVTAQSFPEQRADQLAEILLGISVTESLPATPERRAIRPRLGLVVRAVIPQSSAARRGIRPGDIILEVDREAVDDRAAFRRAISKLRGRRQVLLLVQRGRRAYPVTLAIS
jgi:serine protease Do